MLQVQSRHVLLSVRVHTDRSASLVFGGWISFGTLLITPTFLYFTFDHSAIAKHPIGTTTSIFARN